MSASVVRQLRAALRDETTGMAAAARALLVANPEEYADTGAVLRVADSDVNFVRWSLSGVQQPTRLHNVAVVPQTIAPDFEGSQLQSAGLVEHRVAIDFETFAREGDVIEATVTLFAGAVIRVLRALPDYSAAHGGTVQLVTQPVVTVGAFNATAPASPTTSGFRCVATVLEFAAT